MDKNRHSIFLFDRRLRGVVCSSIWRGGVRAQARGRRPSSGAHSESLPRAGACSRFLPTKLHLKARSQRPKTPRPRPGRGTPRILTAVPICDGHDSAIITINLEFARHGIEVVYLGYHRSARDVVRAAIQEDAQAIGLSSYNGGHIEFFSEVMRMLRREGAGDIGVFGGGGGTITLADAKLLKRRGVSEIFFAGTLLEGNV